jgi:hypothetical protein
MTLSTSNNEAVARDICSRQLSRNGTGRAATAADVDRFWHCVAAELEAGHIDDAGNPIPNISLDEGLEAYRDWCKRHPESRPLLQPCKFAPLNYLLTIYRSGFVTILATHQC